MEEGARATGSDRRHALTTGVERLIPFSLAVRVRDYSLIRLGAKMIEDFRGGDVGVYRNEAEIT